MLRREGIIKSWIGIDVNCASIGFANSSGMIKIDHEIILSKGNKNEN